MQPSLRLAAVCLPGAGKLIGQTLSSVQLRMLWSDAAGDDRQRAALPERACGIHIQSAGAVQWH